MHKFTEYCNMLTMVCCNLLLLKEYEIQQSSTTVHDSDPTLVQQQ